MKKRLEEGGVETPSLDARIILEERCGFDWSDIVSKGHEEVSPEHCKQVHCDVEKRLSGKPISRIYNKAEFLGLPFKLSPDTLDPRPDTELIIDLALQRFSKDNPPQRILDLGTGSGCILISLLLEFTDATGLGTDLSEGALEMARYNAQQNAAVKRCSFMQGSWWDALEIQNDAQKVQQKFDLIVSNPPYISNHVIPNLSKEVWNHDPILGLDGGADGLHAYKIIFSKLKHYLSPHGIALFEIGYDQEKDIMRLSEESGFALRTVHVDLAGNPRVVEISCGDK